MIAGVVILHVWALHVSGQNNPTGVEVKNIERDTVPFTPYATLKDGFALGEGHGEPGGVLEVGREDGDLGAAAAIVDELRRAFEEDVF